MSQFVSRSSAGWSRGAQRRSASSFRNRADADVAIQEREDSGVVLALVVGIGNAVGLDGKVTARVTLANAAS